MMSMHFNFAQYRLTENGMGWSVVAAVQITNCNTAKDNSTSKASRFV